MASSNPFLPLTWDISTTELGKVHSSSSACYEDHYLAEVVEAAAIKAIDILEHNLRDNSMYLLFEWNTEDSKLLIALTDATKSQDAPEVVSLQLTQVSSNEELRESIKFWLHDFLCSYPGFLRYSLVAAFHSSERRFTELL